MVPARINAAILVTDQLAEQRAFYERLGWKSEAPAGATFVPIALAGAALVLTDTESALEQAGVPHRLGLLAAVGKEERVDEALAAAAAAGAEVVQPARPRPFGRGGWFRDPIGTTWEMVWSSGAGGGFGTPPDPDGALVPRLNTVTVRTDDVMPLRRFYEQLGFRSPMEDRDDIVQFQLSGAVFSAWVAHEMKELVGDPLERAGFTHPGYEFGIVVESPDAVDAAIEVARRAGANVFGEAEDQWWGGRSAHFCDLDGNVWEIVHIPSAQLNEKNELVLGGAPAPE